MNATTIHDPRQLAGVLLADPIGAAYLLGDLEEPYFKHTRWFGACTKEGAIQTVLLVYTGLDTPVLLTYGEREGLEHILKKEKHHLPGNCFGLLWPGHDTAFEKIYNPASTRRMIRMGLESRAFRPSGSADKALPLDAKDLPDLMDLMEHYPGNYFEPSMFREGLYYGIRLDGRLVSAGGVHTYSPTYGVAAVGNIVTHGDFRRRGLASSCTKALVRSLLREVDHIALNVAENNTAAIRCYEPLGFAVHMSYSEGVYRKRDIA
jgi:ribosomal protein S18 acetylase RimI-like enzyme